jgi:hypothetical protein
MLIKYIVLSESNHYDCLSINEYKEEVFEEDYIIITPDNTCDNNSLILTKNIE